MPEATSRNVLITGASGGIGGAICKALLIGGHRVVGIARRTDRLPDHPAFTPETLNLADLDALPQQLNELNKRHPVDALVLCAGIGRFGALEEFSYEQIRSLIDINFTSQAFAARAFLPQMKRRPFSDVIIIGSEAALSGGRRGAVYCASKFALKGLAEALRDECAKSGVRVTMINPGMVNTGFFEDLSFSPGEAPENYVEPEDVAAAVDLVLKTRPGTVFDEINLSPLKKVVRFKPKNQD